MRWLDGIIDSMDMTLSKLWEIVKDREVWHAAVHEVAKSDNSQKLPQSQTTAKNYLYPHYKNTHVCVLYSQLSPVLY